MSIAAIYDVHGNLPALEAVLEEVLVRGVDRIVVGGDVVPGPMPGECLSALSALPLPVEYILGNGEIDTLAAARGDALPRVPETFHDAMRWSARQLAKDQLAGIESWPRTLEIHIHGLGTVQFCHATPRDDNEIFTEDTPEPRLRPIFESTGADIVLCGHTHMQFDRTVGVVRVVNAGSVGMPFGDPHAHWALLTPQGIDLRRTVYDLDEAAVRIAETEYPTPFDPRQPPRAADMLAMFEAAALG
jgi:predicted phosphodiesterase